MFSLVCGDQDRSNGCIFFADHIGFSVNSLKLSIQDLGTICQQSSQTADIVFEVSSDRLLSAATMNCLLPTGQHRGALQAGLSNPSLRQLAPQRSQTRRHALQQPQRVKAVIAEPPPQDMAAETARQPHGRTYNFSAGPAVLPVPVLEEAQRDLLNYQGCGASVMELSHRGKEFTNIINKAEADLRQLLSIPDNYEVPAATGRPSCVPCLLAGTEQDTLVYINLVLTYSCSTSSFVCRLELSVSILRHAGAVPAGRRQRTVLRGAAQSDRLWCRGRPHRDRLLEQEGACGRPPPLHPTSHLLACLRYRWRRTSMSFRCMRRLLAGF